MLCIALLLAGCAPLPGGPYEPVDAPGTGTDEDAYAALRNGQFLVLADFETAAQVIPFTLEPPDTPGGVSVSTEQARRRTGHASLKMSFFDASQRVVWSDVPASPRTLIPDWSDYPLLVFSVFSPRPLGGFWFGISSGAGLRRDYQHPRIMLQPGWNLIQLDLGELEDRLDLADVRELRFGCNPLDTPVNLYLDDILLVNDATELYRSPGGPDGEFYVRSVGRRLMAGTTSGFELVFADGQIRRWYDLRREGGRTRNLAGPGNLGPTPIPLIGRDLRGNFRLSSWTPAGSPGRSEQRLVEATPLRIIIEGEQHHYMPGETTDTEGLVHHWTWTVYRDGRAYVVLTGGTRLGQFQPEAVGVLFACSGDLGFDCHLAEAPAPLGAPHRRTFGLFARPLTGMADLLVVPFDPLPASLHDDAVHGRPGLYWTVRPRNDAFRFTAMIRFSSDDLDSREAGLPPATDYTRSAPIRLDAGRLVRTDPGDFDRDGFNEGRGCHVIQLEGGSAIIHLDGRDIPWFQPTFRVVDVAGRDLWVTLNGRVLRNTCPDPEGGTLIVVPETVSNEALIEIVSRE
jgi:hypothetical protein